MASGLSDSVRNENSARCKQMLCGSSVARAAPTISAINKIKKEDKFVIRRINSFLSFQ